MAWERAVKSTSEGILLEVSVTTNATPRFPDGFDPWRKRIGIRVAAIPEDGAANQEVLHTIGAFFDANAALSSGAKSRQKSVRVNIPRDSALEVLRVALE